MTTLFAKKIILASNNPHKLFELKTALRSLSTEFVLPSTYGIDSPDETAPTFVENALIKARYVSEKTGLPAIADDSGLCVEALQGKPGIYSARYAGMNAHDQNNIDKLLSDLEKINDQERHAYFYCSIVFLRQANDPTPIICQGVWHGQILFAPRGEQGFGYDPIFYIPEKNCTAAELSLAEKNKISHRGQAIQALLIQLRYLNEFR
jgi:XTP/dITP diphosphohydrolase